ncbi:MAG: hypothetical protein QHJ73_07710 [Armatimonadota bacterium]|nr:hypothetical protein [Armatimonadota bacterium]
MLVWGLGAALWAGVASQQDAAGEMTWKAGIAAARVTPEQPLYLAGYGSARPSQGKRHDLWVKALALEDAAGKRAVLVTSDLVGFSKENYERLCAEVYRRYGIGRERLMLTSSHNHCAPVTTNVLPDYYPLNEDAWRRVDEYTRWLEVRVVQAVDEAIAGLAPALLAAGEGTATFAVNRRNNPEAEVPQRQAAGTLVGPVDHRVPVLAVRSPGGGLRAVVFGYACHPTTLSDNLWCGDYPGYAQLALEKSHPGAKALFWTGCGGDQNPLPRRSAALCEGYGQHLAAAVERTLAGPLRPLSPRLEAAFQFVPLHHERTPTREEVQADAAADGVRGRWARRMLRLFDAAQPQPSTCQYGVQAWRLGAQQLWIALGAEAVVDYSLRFQREFGAETWVCGYAHDMVGYIPSRRVWEEGGYEGDHLYEYGWLAYRWAGDVEERIAAAVRQVVQQVCGKP